MKRSEINNLIDEARVLFAGTGFRLPPFAGWTFDDWLQKGPEADEIRLNGLGWDVTDYGLGRFEQIGLLLFTIRNGNYQYRDRFPKGYAEKVMMVKENQVTPWHYHWKKREDIINRGGGNLVLELRGSDGGREFAHGPVEVAVDGVRRLVEPGKTVILTPGESICLEPYLFHTFYGEAGGGAVVVGEVSDVNDDVNDNCFYDRLGRFPEIREDEAPRYLLCHEYPPAAT